MARKAVKPKVRTGCLKCKLRRIKCDERKPECICCIKYWGSCDGYAKNAAKASTGVKTRLKGFLLRSQPRVDPSFDNEQDLRYFKIFCSVTAASLGGAFDSCIWKRIIPQACTQERFVQDAMIAIGALTQTVHNTQLLRRLSTAPGTDQKSFSNSPDYTHAIALYGRSLKGMRNTPLVEDKHIRMALIACLLVFCFECFCGSPMGAMTHANHGINLLCIWLEKYGVPNSSMLKSPAPQVIEDELIQAYSRLEIQVLTFQPRLQDRHKSLLKYDVPIQNFPTVFSSLNQARAHWDHIIRRACHFIPRIWNETKIAEVEMLRARRPDKDVFWIPMKMHTLSSSLPEKKRHTLEMGRDECMDELSRWEQAYEPLFLAQQQQNKRQQQQSALPTSTSSISATALPSSQCPRANIEHLGPTILKIYGLVSHVIIASTLFTSELCYDSLLPVFKRIYTLIASIYKPLTAPMPWHSSGNYCCGNDDDDNCDVKVSYHFYPSALPALFSIVANCRHRLLRRAAIRLLASSFHREGIWDSMALARVGTWLVGIEEDGLVDDIVPGSAEKGRDQNGGLGVSDDDDEFPEETVVIPEYKRAHIKRFHIDLIEHKAYVECCQRESQNGEGLVWSKAVLQW